jgi:hypothetical protein
VKPSLRLFALTLLTLGAVAAEAAPDAPPGAGAGFDPDAKGPPEEDFGNLGAQPLGTDALLALQERWKAAGKLTLSQQSYWADETVIEDGVCRANLKKGILIPILSGGQGVPERKVGVVFVGNGEMALRFPKRASALTFANHMVLKAGKDRQELAPVAHQERPFTDSITRAVIFSADPVVEGLLAKLDPVGGGMVERARADGVDAEYVVTSDRGELKARAIARDLLPERRLELFKGGLDPIEILRFDRMLHEELGTPGSKLRMIADFRTETRFHVATGAYDSLGSKEHDKWLTCYRDGTDHRDTGLASVAFAHGTDSLDQQHLVQFSGLEFPPEAPGLAPMAQSRIEAVRAEVTAEVTPTRSMAEVKVKVTSKLVLRAREENVRSVVMRLPRHEAVEKSWQLDKLAVVSGAPLGWLEIDSGLPAEVDARPPNKPAAPAGSGGGAASGGSEGASAGATSVAGSSEISASSGALDHIINPEVARVTSRLIEQRMERRQEVLVVLPTPLKYGEEVEIELNWQARWPFARWSTVESAQGERFQSNGASTGLRSLLPELLPTLGGTPWDVKATIGVPPRRVDVAITGETMKEWVDEGGWNWTSTQAEHVRRPAVALGRWQSKADPSVPSAGLPAVRAHLFGSSAASLDQFGPEVRRVLTFLRRFLPLPSGAEIDVFQGPSNFVDEAFAAAHEQTAAGMVGIQTITVAGVVDAGNAQAATKHITQTQIARQVAGQVWGQTVAPASERDAWFVAALSDAYSAFYVRAALKEEGFNDFEGRVEHVRKELENPTDRNVLMKNDQRQFISLTDGGSLFADQPRLFDDYAFFLFSRVLRERLGDYAYFRALDRFARQYTGQRVTTEQLLASLEAHTGADLQDFFDFWVYGGFIPAVTVEYRVEDTQNATGRIVYGCVVADVPFGRFDVPVAVLDQGGARRVAALVEVEDGRGGFSLIERSGDIEVQVDPQQQILSYSRKVDRVKQTTCEREAAAQKAPGPKSP